jgi:predicted XRE-type DNA-binding protein
MMKDGMNQSQIAKALNISQPTLSVFIKKFLMKEEISN